MQLRGLSAVVLLAGAMACAQPPTGLPVQVKQPEMMPVTREQYRASLARMEALVAACRSDARKCDAAAVGPDEKVDQGFEARFDWLREALHAGADAKAKDRDETLAAAADRLNEDAADAAAAAAPAALKELPAAHAKAAEILSRKEFRQVEGDSWWDRKLAQAQLFVEKVFSSAANMIPQPAWMSEALEAGTIGLGAVALLVWAWKVNQQQRVAIAEARGGGGEVWRRESDNWAERARTEAARGDWREAVHCLYWSAIVMLEGQRLWRQNRARTPREYVALLEPGSERQQALGGLTRVFERIWYGLRPAAESDYVSATAMLERLRTR